MSVTILLPTLFRARAGGRPEVAVEAATVGEAITRLLEQYPLLRPDILADDGRLQRFLNIYLRDEDIRHLDGLRTPLRAGDALIVVPAVAGG